MGKTRRLVSRSLPTSTYEMRTSSAMSIYIHLRYISMQHTHTHTHTHRYSDPPGFKVAAHVDVRDKNLLGHRNWAERRDSE